MDTRIRQMSVDELNSLTTDMVEQVYSGKQGCMCGCLGKYWETGPMVKKILNIVKSHVHLKLQDGYIMFIDYPIYDRGRNYVVYLKKDRKFH